MQANCVEDLALFLNSQTTVPFKKMSDIAEKLHSKLKTQIFAGNCANSLPISLDSGSAYQPFTRYPDHFVTFQNRIREKIVNQEEEI